MFAANRTNPAAGGAVKNVSNDPNAPKVAKAVGAADLDSVKPVPIKAPTVIEAGDHDPYDAVRPVSNDGAATNKAPEISGPAALPGDTPEKRGRPATAVNPNEQNAASLPTVKIDPPQPLEFN